MRLAALAAVGAMLAGAAQARTLVITADGSGSCTASGCNNTGTTTIADPLTQNIGGADTAYGWWAFTLPTFEPYERLVGATLTIWNPGAGVQADSPSVEFYLPTTISFAGLADQSNILASWNPLPGQAGDAQFASVAIPAFNLSFLDSLQGGQLVFGANPSGVHGDDQFASFFGGSGGIPRAAISFALAAPEPGTWALSLTGFLGLGVIIRRRRASLA